METDMKKKILAVYDIMGIQEFIFGSNRLKENLGASIIVQQVLEKELVGAMKDCCGDEHCHVNWQADNSSFEIASHDEIEAEVIYIGGGNAMVAYQNKPKAIEITKNLSRRILEQTGGTLQFVVAYHETTLQGKNFQDDRKAVFRELKKNKYQFVQTLPLLGIGITRQGDTDGLPAVERIWDKDVKRWEYFSQSGDGKREQLSEDVESSSGTKKKYANPYDSLRPGEGWDFPLKLDELGQKEGDHDIAVVHIDGNNMGQQLDNVLSKISDYNQAVKTLREFSQKVDDTYENVLRDVIKSLRVGLKNQTFRENFELTDKRLPIRPIVRNGDDVTFVCHGRLGITLAEEFLRALDRVPEIRISGQTIKLSACSGVAIVKSHFPFSRAYQLSEELCASAKTKAKILAKLHNQEHIIGNWLDFHIVQSGITTDLSELRTRFYQISSVQEIQWKSPPEPLQYPEHTKQPGMKYQQYNLLWRPWCVAGCDIKDYQWDVLRDIYDQFTNKWKRSRLKRLRNTMIRSKEEIEYLEEEFRSRHFILPLCFGDSQVFRDSHVFKKDKGGRNLFQTPYFDALELLDVYLPIPEQQGGKE